MLLINIENLTLLYFQNSLDVPYKLKKGDSINIKPILVKDYSTYEWAKEILDINKNEINDIEIIQMSYLDFIINKLILSADKEHQKKHIGQLFTICKLCLGEQYVDFDLDNNKISLVICDENRTIKSVINSKEFDDIRKIILNQNDSNYDNRYISPDVKEAMQEYYKVKYSNIESPSLEKRKAFVSSKTGKTFAELNNIPYREFDLIYRASVDSEIYIGQKIIQGSFKYDIKEDIRHPLFEKAKDPYSEIFEDTNVLSNKGISGVEKLNNLK